GGGVRGGRGRIWGKRFLRIILRPANERLGQALLMRGVIPAVAAFDAEPRLVAGTLPALRPEDAVILDVIGEGAADAAVRADAIDRGRLRTRDERERERLV